CATRGYLLVRGYCLAGSHCDAHQRLVMGNDSVGRGAQPCVDFECRLLLRGSALDRCRSTWNVYPGETCPPLILNRRPGSPNAGNSPCNVVTINCTDCDDTSRMRPAKRSSSSS